MDHSSHSAHSSSGSGSGVPTPAYMQQMYWAVVGAAIAAAALVNVLNHVICRQRLRAAANGQPTPAKPKSLPLRWLATATAIAREANYASLAPISFRGYRIPLPTVGRTSLVLANVVVLIVLCFYKLDTTDLWEFEDIGYRTGFITICQLPLIFLLAGKNNIVGWLTGSSYERLNWLHRWAARCLLLTATIHMGFWFANWMAYDYVGVKVSTDPLTQRGLIAWAILVWITLSSVAPIRGWRYEFFVLQHLVSFAALTGMVYIHTQKKDRVYVWICVGLFFFDRLLRALKAAYANLAIFHPKLRADGTSRFWACDAEFAPLVNSTTRVTIHKPLISWRAGQHVFLSCHSIVPLQSHPFTISSLPEDGKMEFFIKAEKGGTKQFFAHAEKHSLLPAVNQKSLNVRAVAIEGPYGYVRPLRQFDSVVFITGGTGATFTMPLLREIVNLWRQSSQSSSGSRAGVVTRFMRFVWVVRSRGQLSMFSEQLEAVREEVERSRHGNSGLGLDVTCYVTCDDEYAGEPKPQHAPTSSGGQVELLRAKTTGTDVDEKKVDPLTTEREEDASQVSSIEQLEQPRNIKACSPDGTCCCRTVVAGDGVSPSNLPECRCNATISINPDEPPSSSDASQTTNAHSSIGVSMPLLTGRPEPRSIIRGVLEQALGESAVVVCGPRGMVDDVRQSVVYLSDERAVHKGTGAQGIWLHTEVFGY